MNPIKPIILSIFFCLLVWFIWSFNLKPLQINKEINWVDYYVKTGQCEKALKRMETNVLPSQSIIDSYAKLKYIDIIQKCEGKIPGLKLASAPKAISVLKETGEIRPYYTRTWLFLGNYTNLLIENSSYLKIKNIEELKKQAYSYFEKASQLSPKREQLFVSWIYTDLLSGKYQAAKEKAEQCIKLNSESSYCWWLKGLSNVYLEEIEQSEKNIKIAIEKGHNPNSETSLSQLVKAYAKLIEETNDLKYYEKTADIYQKLVLIEPDNYRYYVSLGHAYDMLGEYRKLADMYQKLVLIEPDNYRYYVSLGHAYNMLEEYRKLADMYQKLVLIEPDNHNYRASLGYAYNMLGEYEKALDIYQKLVLIEPDNHSYHASLAYVYEKLGEYGKAKEQALIVIKLMPDLKEDMEKFLKTLP